MYKSYIKNASAPKEKNTLYNFLSENEINITESSIKKGKNALKGYFETYRDSWNKNLFTEYNVKVDFDLDKNSNLTLSGTLDKLELIDAHNVCVVDYKTSKPKSRNELEGKTKNADGNYKRQLVFYKLLLGLEGKFKMNSGLIDFIEPNDSGNYKKEQFIIEDSEVQQLLETIKECSDDVVNLKFIDRRCDQDDCEYCKLADLV
jgi:CRISPR/Cas system-associated exonuclease Cas4 (RecB family)